MAGPGGGPPRRSRNCTKHKIRCPYNDVQVPDAERSTTPDKPDLMWTPQIEAAIGEWQATGVFPFPSLGVYPAPMPHMYSLEDLRLIYHVASLYHQLAAIDANNFTLWTRHILVLLRIGATTPYVMHALLAFSAMHIAFLTDCPLVGSMAFEHRGIALSGLHEAINSFSRETSDAILAASLVLSWQATDWRSWTQLMQGTSTVIDAMDSWKHESLFGDFIAESSTFPTAPSSPSPDHRPSQPSEEDLHAYQRTLEQVQKVEAFLKRSKEDTTQLQHLIGFLKGARKITPTLSIAGQYERLQPLRTWLFWMPVGYLQSHQGSPNSLVIIAHLYTVAILMERLFPEIGAAYFGSLSISPVEEIARRLMSYSVARSDADKGAHHQTPLALMEFPIDTVAEFRSRMGWNNPERTPSFPQFHPPNFPVPHDVVEQRQLPHQHQQQQQHQHQHQHQHQLQHQLQHQHQHQHPNYVPYGTAAFSYGADAMPMLNSASTPARGHQPLPHFASPQYLAIPSPTYRGSYSPASSTIEGSVTYSDVDDYGSTLDLGYTSAPCPPGQPFLLGEAQHRSYGVGNLRRGLVKPLSTTLGFAPPDDAANSASSRSSAPSPYLHPESLAMLPLPESPLSTSSPPRFPIRHPHQAAAVSGRHPNSPLAQMPLVSHQDFALRRDRNGRTSPFR
ncbi:C6 transcription factor [Drechmeria coniospora]|uniref:C6 transcription factor n=1 Tax=Drechmeria coniospora TaxID=98403 RepID=A0A151GIY4_DRECN|nr:C6 transcription factor [Drechmeria coniospora]KYK57060.1 C6 transcription factor [Drechmeria coniospora]